MRRGIVDVSSVIWTCLLAGKDKEFGREYRTFGDITVPYSSTERLALEREHGEGKKVFVNSASYGYENAINFITKALGTCEIYPRDLILVVEGREAKTLRQYIYPGYKNTRDRTDEQYAEFRKCRDQFVQALLDVGAQMATQDGVEGDDIIGYLCQNLDGEKYVISNDKDLAVLVNPEAGVHLYRLGAVDQHPFPEQEGLPYPMITTYLALVGDTDEFPGAKGFGETAFARLHYKFGNEGLWALEGLIKDRKLKALEEDVQDLQKEIEACTDKDQGSELRKLQKSLQVIIDNQDMVYISYDCARLMPDKVNTPRRPLQWRVGMVKPAAECHDERLRHFAGTTRLVTAENFEKARHWIIKEIKRSPYVAFDVETSTPPESDEWLEAMDKTEERTPVDVLASKLTSAQLTFGQNMQHTVYITIDHVEEPGVTNVSVEQVADLMNEIPRSKKLIIHNVGFELPVCYNGWGDLWRDDPEYHGFLRNVRCTQIASSYVDENRSSGLKSLSKDLLEYDQTTYQDTVRRTYTRRVEIAGKDLDGDDAPRTVVEDTYPGFGRIVSKTVEVVQEVTDDCPVGIEVHTLLVEHKMNQLKARETFSYGCDDPICTAALANHFWTIMELEKTFKVYEDVETWTAYVQAKGFLDGAEFSLESMASQERDDDLEYNEAWVTLRDYLIKIGFEGTVTPRVMTKEDLEVELAKNGDPDYDPDKDSALILLNPAGVKRIFNIVTGEELKTRVMKADKLGKLIGQWAEENGHTAAALLGKAVAEGDMATLNQLVADHYDGEPQLDLASSKQMCNLLYDRMGIPVTLTNEMTALEWAHKREMGEAINRLKQVRLGKLPSLSDQDKLLVRKKAKANDDAIDYAIAFNSDVLDDDAKRALKAIGRMKKVMTRRSLFYKNYWKAVHWKTGRIHSNIRQVGTVTRRPTASMPNIYQLPKKGEGVRFREHYKPHKKKAVVVSIDFNAQELRLGAHRSQDKNMLACYIGDNKKDIHSITAAGAMKLKWGVEAVREYFATFGDSLSHDDEGQYSLFRRLHVIGKKDPVGKKADDLRKDAKNVNFLAQFGGQALKLSETLIMLPTEAQLFLDARSAMFPDVDKAARRAEDECRRTGYARTMLGARRHLREAILSADKKAASRAARQSWNMEIQGSAGEMTKLAMSSLWRSGALHRYDVRFFASIYDELVVSVDADQAVDFIREMHACMVQPYADMSVPIVASISLGADFANQIECGDDFIEANIRAALDEIFHREEEHA